MNCWSRNSLNRVTSIIETPIFADECTSKQTRIFYARMLVEVNVTRELPEVIKVLDPNGRQFTQKIIFDWKPEFCQLCQVVGHKCPPPAKPDTQNHAPQERRREPRKVTMEWKTKGPVSPNATAPNIQVGATSIEMINNVPKEAPRATYIVVQCVEQSKTVDPQPHVQKVKSLMSSLELNLANFPALGPASSSGNVGMNKRYKQKELRNYLKIKNIKLTGLVETNVKSPKAKQVDAQFLHCHVKERQGPLDCIVTVIYGFNAIEHREAMWQGLKQVALGVHVPWLIIGDFNAMLLPQYRIFGNPVTYAEIKAYSEYVIDLLLSELQWKRRMLQWGHVVTEFELPFFSDHPPMILSLKTKARNINVPFRFFNVWIGHQDFLAMVQ
nr:uncharacterized protein LOC104088903 [Nicotiana tomentosiformis]